VIQRGKYFEVGTPIYFFIHIKSCLIRHTFSGFYCYYKEGKILSMNTGNAPANAESSD